MCSVKKNVNIMWGYSDRCTPKIADCRTASRNQCITPQSACTPANRSKPCYTYTQKPNCRRVYPRSCSAPPRRKTYCEIECPISRCCHRSLERPIKLEPIITHVTNKNTPDDNTNPCSPCPNSPCERESSKAPCGTCAKESTKTPCGKEPSKGASGKETSKSSTSKGPVTSPTVKDTPKDSSENKDNNAKRNCACPSTSCDNDPSKGPCSKEGTGGVCGKDASQGGFGEKEVTRASFGREPSAGAFTKDPLQGPYEKDLPKGPNDREPPKPKPRPPCKLPRPKATPRARSSPRKPPPSKPSASCACSKPTPKSGRKTADTAAHKPRTKTPPKQIKSPPPPPNSSNDSIERKKCEPCPPDNQCSEIIGKYDDNVGDHEYIHFLLRITEDILRNDMYSNAGINKVIECHFEANKGRLNEQKMTEQIERLKKELNYPIQNRPNVGKFIVCGCDELKKPETFDTKKCNCGPLCADTVMSPDEKCNCGDIPDMLCPASDEKPPETNPSLEESLIAETEPQPNIEENKKNNVEIEDVSSESTAGSQNEDIKGTDSGLNEECIDLEDCNAKKADPEVVKKEPKPMRPVTSKLNSMFKMIQPELNLEKRISHVALYNADPNDACHCTISLKKTALKIETEGDDDQDYILVEGPVCIPMTMLKEKTTPVMIENLPSMFGGLEQEKENEPIPESPNSKVNLYVKRSSIPKENNTASISAHVQMDCECDMTPQRGDQLAIASGDHLAPGQKHDDEDIPPSAEIPSDFKDKYHYLLRDAATSVSALNSRSPSLKSKRSSINKGEQTMVPKKTSPKKLPSPKRVSPSSSTMLEDGKPIDNMQKYKKKRSSEIQPRRTSQVSGPPKILNYAVLKTSSSGSDTVVIPELKENSDQSSKAPQDEYLNNAPARGKMMDDDSDYDHKDIIKKLDEVPQVDSIDKRNNNANNVTDKLREFRKVELSNHNGRFQSYMNDTDNFEIRRQSSESEKKLLESANKGRNVKGPPKKGMCCPKSK